MGKACVRSWAGPEPLLMGGMWISRVETSAKILRWPRRPSSWKDRHSERVSSLRQKDWSGFPGYESECGPESVRTEQKT